MSRVFLDSGRTLFDKISEYFLWTEYVDRFILGSYHSGKRFLWLSGSYENYDEWIKDIVVP